MEGPRQETLRLHLEGQAEIGQRTKDKEVYTGQKEELVQRSLATSQPRQLWSKMREIVLFQKLKIATFIHQTTTMAV